MGLVREIFGGIGMFILVMSAAVITYQLVSGDEVVDTALLFLVGLSGIGSVGFAQDINKKMGKDDE